MREHPEIQRVIVVEDADVRVEGCRLSFVRFVLDETIRERCQLPRWFLERAVYGNPGGAGGDERTPRAGVRCSRLR